MGTAARIALVVGFLAGCRDKSCLDGTCKLPCDAIEFTCSDAPIFYAGPLGDAPAALRLRAGNGGSRDILISNGRVSAVISALEAPIDLAPTGGNLIDFGIAGGVDDTTLTYQIAGILPEDAFAYTSIEVAVRDASVAVTVRGTLDGRKDVRVVTHYELRACDPGLRVRSELFNGSADRQAFVVADALHWGKRRVVPFAPVSGQGYSQPELDLLELSSLWSPFDFAAAFTPSAESPSYGALACSAEQLHGVNDLEISALGTPMTFTEPGDTIVLERMLVAAGQGEGPARAIDQLLLARTQLFGGPTQTVGGRVVAGGLPFGGNVRRASIVLRAGDRPLTSVVPADDGTFSARVPGDREVTAEVWSFGRKVAERTGTVLGDIEVPEPATVQLHVERLVAGQREAAWAIAVFTPDDDATRADVTGTFHGRLDACAPWLGPPNGASPACNQVIVHPQGTDVEVPAGKYAVIATAGPEHTIDIHHVQLQPGEVVPITIDIEKLDMLPADYVSADFHVHGRASFDSGIPDEDRVRTFVASGVDVIAATDHDVIGDYTDVVARLDLEDRVVVMPGLETTQLIPWLEIPGEDLPRVIGHFNFWPLERDPAAPRAGAPWDELVEPGELFDRIEPLFSGVAMRMINHPWGEPQFGRDLGYLRAIEFDPRVAIDDRSTLLRTPGTKHRNIDWNVIEIINGADMSEAMQARTLWHSLLAQGFTVAGTGNSDSHGMIDDKLGWARNWVPGARAQDGRIASDAVNVAVQHGTSSAGNGVIVRRWVEKQGDTIAHFGPVASSESLEIEVLAAPWIPVDEVRVVTSKGTRVIASGAELAQPTNPFGTDFVRYRASIPLGELVERDDFVIVEAGMAYPLAADLDDDGVLDTTDNNGDGVVDQDDVDPDEDVGPLKAPPDPIDPADRRYLLTRIVPGGWPVGFANPILVDHDGDGMWAPPGVAR